MTDTDQQIRARVRDGLRAIYGARLARAVLFGSRARGDAGPDSDYDVAVFLRAMDDRFAEIRRLAALSSEIMIATGELVHAMPYGPAAYEERTPLMREIRLEGVDL